MVPVPFALRALPPEASALLAAAVDGTPDAFAQFGIAGAIVVPLASALLWYVKRSETRWQQALDRSEARGDRADIRLAEVQERFISLLLANTEANSQVAQANRDLVQAVRDLQRGSR